jgi:antitoxin (DNA-binding transcriptional repressor) of toxin-antitoxin stability system
MRSVGLKVLKNRLREYVRLASQGETVLVRDRDRVVAELRPPEGGRSEFVSDALLADAVRTGLLRPPVVRCDSPPERKPVMPLDELLRQLSRDRDDR